MRCREVDPLVAMQREVTRRPPRHLDHGAHQIRLGRQERLVRHLDDPLQRRHVGERVHVAPRPHQAEILAERPVGLGRQQRRDLAPPEQVELVGIVGAEPADRHVAVRIEPVLRQEVAQIPVAAGAERQGAERFSTQPVPVGDGRGDQEVQADAALQTAADDLETVPPGDRRHAGRRAELADLQGAGIVGGGDFRPAEHHLDVEIDALAGEVPLLGREPHIEAGAVGRHAVVQSDGHGLVSRNVTRRAREGGRGRAPAAADRSSRRCRRRRR